jgi:predicted Zn-dependent protease with MMP-like domain
MNVVLDPSEFELLVEDALRRIPLRFRRRMNNVAIIVEKEPPRSGLLGLY